jgi:phenylacetate-coenzyme A ligase PaaK-like adenylate-forming protein
VNNGNPIRLLFSDALRTVVFPSFQRRRTPSAFHLFRELQSLEFAPSQTIQELQCQKLSKLLKHAAQHVPYYRETFRANGFDSDRMRSFQDFRQVPVLTKDMLKQNADALLAESGDTGDRRKNASGGSTGKPAQFYQDRFYWEFAMASQWFVESWWSIRPGDRTGSVWGCDRDIPQQSFRERLAQEICQVRTCNAFAITEQRLEDFSKMLIAWRPRYITGYASALELFSKFLLSRPELKIRPVAVKSTAEALSVGQKKVIEAAFQAPLYNFYGSREVNNLAAECPAHRGLHVNSLGRYMEVADEHGNPLPAGVPGRILVTDLTNFAMPFIRYEIEDVGVWSDASCPCGRPFPLLAEVLGRSSDFIATPSGKIIHGEYFTHLFYDFPQVESFRLTQDSLSHIHLDVVLQPGSASSFLEPLRQRISAVLGPEMNCEIRTVDKLKRTASGKFRFTVSSVGMPWSLQQNSPVPR